MLHTECESGACVSLERVCVIRGCSRTRAALSRRVHGPVQLPSELLPVVHVNVVEHVLMHHICLRREAETS